MLHLSSHSCAERPVGPTEIGRRSAASARHCQLESHSGGAADGSRTGWKLTAMVAGQEVSPLPWVTTATKTPSLAHFSFRDGGHGFRSDSSRISAHVRRRCFSCHHPFWV